jgi:positive regulator of sigma E activity
MTEQACMTASGVACRDAAGGRVAIQFAAPAQCRGCQGVCTWRRMPLVDRADFATTLPLRAGDEVVVSLPERYVLLGTLLVHGLPLAALLGGALIGVAAFGNDLGCVAGALSALGLTVAATPRLRHRIETMTLREVTVERRRAVSV